MTQQRSYAGSWVEPEADAPHRCRARLEALDDQVSTTGEDSDEKIPPLRKEALIVGMLLAPLEKTSKGCGNNGNKYHRLDGGIERVIAQVRELSKEPF